MVNLRQDSALPRLTDEQMQILQAALGCDVTGTTDPKVPREFSCTVAVEANGRQAAEQVAQHRMTGALSSVGFPGWEVINITVLDKDDS